MDVGVGFTPFETRTDVIARLAEHAEAAGLARVDVAEGWTHDALIVLAELAARTSSIGLGTSVVSVWGRSPRDDRARGGGPPARLARALLAGHRRGSPPLAEGLHGVPWERPLGRLRDTVTAVRALLTGERLPAPAGGARPLRLGVIPEPPVPIVLAALAPGSIRLAGELADAWAPFLWARSRSARGARCWTRARRGRPRRRPPASRSASRSPLDRTRRARAGSPRGGSRPT